MSTHHKIIIIGGGGMGLSAAWRLARRGEKPLVIEQFSLFHNRGSSHAEHRILRRTYDDDLYARLVVEAYRLWEELEGESGQRLKYLYGGLEIGPHTDKTLNNIIDVCRATGIPIDVFSPAELGQRYPQWHVRPDFIALFCPLNGFLAIDDCMRAKAELAAKGGVIFQENEPVEAITPLANGVEIRTAKGTYTCDRLIITAGAYAKKLMRQIGLDVPYIIESSQVHWFKVDSDEMYRPERFPIFILRHDTDTIGGMYGFPLFRKPGIKVAVHHSNDVIDVENYTMQPNPTTTERVAAFVREFLPGAAAQPAEIATCLYDFPPDEHFVIAQHPEFPHISMANMAGHGYKFAPLVGEVLAQFAVDGHTTYDLTGLGVDRFFSEAAARRDPIHVDVARRG
jgi:monomeric sarcosine oxidase